MKRTIFILWIVFLSSLLSFADKIEYSINEDGIQITYAIENLYQEESSLYPGSTKFMIEDFGLLELEGYPSLLQKIESFQIPEGKRVGEITFTTETEIIKCRCIPSTPIHTDGESLTEGIIRPFEGTWPATNVVQVESVSYRGNNIGKIAVAPLQYNYEKEEVYFAKIININIPFVNVSLKNTPLMAQKSSSPKTKGNLDQLLTIHNPAFCNEDRITNFSENEASPLGLTLPSLNLGKSAPTLLILTPEEFKSEAERFAESKSRLGYSVEIETAPAKTLSKPEEAYKIIKRAYDWYGNVEHVLLFGAGSKIKPFSGELKPYFSSQYNTYYTDYYYACLDAEHPDLIDDPYCLEDPNYTPDYSIKDQDRFADVSIGRFPGESLEDIKNMIDKSISYEMNPPVNDPNYFSTSIHFSESAGKTSNLSKDEYVFVQSIEKLDEALKSYPANLNVETTPKKFYFSPSDKVVVTQYHDYTPIPTSVIECLKTEFKNSDIVDAINSGCSYILYRGHGNETAWSHSWFSLSDCAGLNNENRYPGVYAITCLSGRFLRSDNDTQSICQELLRGKNKGAAFAICANNESLSGLNEYMMAGIFNAMYPSVLPHFTLKNVTNPIQNSYPSVSELGSIVERAKETMTAMYYDPLYWFNHRDDKDSPTYYQYNKEIYHCLGDPTLKVYKKKPTKYYPTIFKIGNSIRLFHQGLQLVLRRKGTKNVVFLPQISGDYYDIKDYLDNYDLSLIGEGYVPVFINTESLTSTTSTPDLVIESVSHEGSQTKVCYNSDTNQVVFKLYDIYGNLIDSANGNNGTAYLNSANTFGVVVMEQDGIIVDSKRIKN